MQIVGGESNCARLNFLSDLSRQHGTQAVVYRFQPFADCYAVLSEWFFLKAHDRPSSITLATASAVSAIVLAILSSRCAFLWQRSVHAGDPAKL
jgi:hypothetical protein